MDKKLLNKMRNIVNKHDPIGIYFGKDKNFDEYDPEIKDIYNKFKKVKNLEQFTNEVHKVFIKWFDSKIAREKKKIYCYF